MRGLSFLLSGLILLFLLAGGYAYKELFIPVGGENEFIFEVPPGSSFYGVANRLKEDGLIRDLLVFRIYGRLTGASTSIQVGEYRLASSMSPSQILKSLVSGRSLTYRITFPEGFNIFEISNLLNEKWPGRGDEFLRLVRDQSVIKKYFSHDIPSLEGYLFPDTYSVTKYTPVGDLIDMMVKNFKANYQEIVSASPKLQMEISRHVTFASVVEKETGVAEERPLISSVFHNRLRKKMRIQSDPTIIYGHWVKTGEYLHNIRRTHIRTPTDYNTYTIPALPIGPVANPGREALWAALNPESSDYLYFVSRNDGTHVFSKTLKEHNQNVRKYQIDRRAREGKSWRQRSQ